MGVVKGVKITPSGKVEYTISVDYEDSLMLKGHATNMFIFSEDAADIKANVKSRGQGNTKYLRIPREISKGIDEGSEIKCLRMDAKDKIIMFTVVQK